MNRTPVRAWVAGLGVLALALCASPARAGHYSWTTSGPKPGRIYQIVIDGNDPSTMLAVAGYFGPLLFRTTDRGASWRNVENFLSAFVVPDPTDPSVLYAPSYGSILKSTDGGASWFPIALPDPSLYFAGLAIAPSDPHVLYGAAQGNPGRVFRSADAGMTWSLVATNLVSYDPRLAIDPIHADVLFAISGTGLVKSVDGGLSWTPSATGLSGGASFLKFSPDDPSTIYAATSDSGVFKSVDGGLTWNPANVGMETNDVRDLAFDSLDPSVIYAASDGPAGATGGLYASNDAGGHWSRISLGIGDPEFANAIAVDPQDHSRLVVGGGTSALLGQLRTSSDAGVSFQPTQQGLSGFYSYAVETDPSAEHSAFTISGADFFRSDTDGSDWLNVATLPFALTDLAVDPASSDVLYTLYNQPVNGSSHAGVFKSTNGGVDWVDSSTGLPAATGYRLAIGRSNTQVLMTSTDQGFFKTSDAGASWSPVHDGYGKALAIDPADEQILYAGFSASNGLGDFVRSDDGGATWNAPAGTPTRSAYDVAIDPADPSRVYALFGNKLYRSTDRGLTFFETDIGLPLGEDGTLSRVAIDPSTPSTLYAAGIGHVYRSTNGANSWALLPGLVPSYATIDLQVSASGRILHAATTSGTFEFSRSFLDVADSDPFWPAVDAAAMNGLSAGCGGDLFCPGAVNSRAQIAVFLLRAKNGSAFTPAAASGAVFLDVAADSFAAAWIEELYRDGISGGCGGSNYCPSADLSRAEMAVLVLKTLFGGDYNPPPATGAVFGDVAADSFAAAWIEDLFHRGIAAGCGGGNFCPDASLTRAQAAALLTNAFGLL